MGTALLSPQIARIRQDSEMIKETFYTTPIILLLINLQTYVVQA
jgi:hypothetical protein